MFKPKIKDETCLQTLKEICQKYEMENCYSIGTPVEQRVCLCKRENNWEVFIVERGLEFQKEKHKECIDACLDVIKYCSYSNDEFKSIAEDYKTILLNKISVNKSKIKIKL